MANYASKVIAIAKAEVGYLEKKSNSQLDSKTANAGSNNYTKYARDMDNIPGFYNGKKNGYPWCDIFFDWLFVEAFGVDTAKELLNQPDRSYGAGCSYSARYYKNKGQWHTKDPKPGDQIFFRNYAHTGLVADVDNTYVYTIEGNTSTKAGVVANGCGVWEKKYKLTDKVIDGYGRPNYDEEPGGSIVEKPVVEVKPASNVKIDTVKEVQEWLNESYDAGLVVDGEYGPKTKAALVKVLQKAIGVTADGEYGPKTNAAIKVLKIGSTGEAVKALQGLLVCNGYAAAYVDGSYGSGTAQAVESYQGKNNLDPDGKAGKATFSELCQ